MSTYENSFHAKDQQRWRAWLEKNHATQQSVWLIIYKKESGVPSVYYPEAVDEALCFGWIDSKPNKRDSQSYYQFFSKRNPKSNWSKVNKEKIKRLQAAGEIAPAGQQMIETAKASGTWDALNDVEQRIVPPDLQAALESVPQALDHWQAFPPSTQRGILEWIFNAKRTATRKKRITETAELAGENIRANQYRQPKGKKK